MKLILSLFVFTTDIKSADIIIITHMHHGFEEKKRRPVQRRIVIVFISCVSVISVVRRVFCSTRALSHKQTYGGKIFSDNAYQAKDKIQTAYRGDCVVKWLYEDRFFSMSIVDIHQKIYTMMIAVERENRSSTSVTAD